MESNSTATLGVKNSPAYKLVYNGTKVADNSKVKGSDIFTIQGDKAYSFLYLTQAGDYDTHLPTVQKMIDSFQIMNFTHR